MFWGRGCREAGRVERSPERVERRMKLAISQVTEGKLANETKNQLKTSLRARFKSNTRSKLKQFSSISTSGMLKIIRSFPPGQLRKALHNGRAESQHISYTNSMKRCAEIRRRVFITGCRSLTETDEKQVLVSDFKTDRWEGTSHGIISLDNLLWDNLLQDDLL